MSVRMRFSLLVVALLASLSLAAAASSEPDLSVLRAMPVQEGGRLKPLDTLAIESVRYITGKASFRKQDPLWTFLGWMADPDKASAEQVIECRNLELKRRLGLEEGRRWFSLQELQQNPKLHDEQEAIHEKLRSNAELTPQEKEVSQLLSRAQLLMMILTGELVGAVPNPERMDGEWGSLAELRNSPHPRTPEAVESLAALMVAVRANQADPARSASEKLCAALAAMGPTPPASALQREVHFNHFHPFRWAWIFYAVGFFLLLFAPSSASPVYWLGLFPIVFGFSLHTYGFYLRCMIAGRPPVTNMYESVIWVSFGAMLFALIFEAVYRSRIYVLAAAVGSVVTLVLADNLPAVLDPAIKPLTPVLRSNFWLTIHVLTITLSYAAFLLALVLGHMVVWQYVSGPDRKEQLKTLNQALYKAIQVGVLLLAAGTILGGVWANYSWGRFWGWDPKEVWALIALLGYLALLHARYAGWLRHFGLAAGSIVAFQGVLMAWYGVNFVLGVGLHSYGFGTGGVQYVAVFCGLELLFVGLAAWRHRQRTRVRRCDAGSA
ncbi:MAG: cytochrome c biogenesis protein CcsA [Candidatus Eremiobacterota bacterium]